MLRDAAAFAAHHVDADDAVQQRSLAVVDVAQERDHRRPLDQVGRIVFLRLQVGQQLVFQADGLLELDIDAQLRGDELRSFPDP